MAMKKKTKAIAKKPPLTEAQRLRRRLRTLNEWLAVERGGHFNTEKLLKESLERFDRLQAIANGLEKERKNLNVAIESAINGLLAKFMTKAQEAVAAQNWEPIVRSTVHEQVAVVLKRIDFAGRNLTEFVIEAAKKAVQGPVIVREENVG